MTLISIFTFISRDSGGNNGCTNMNTTPDHNLVIRDSDENILPDVIEFKNVRNQEMLKNMDPNMWLIH